MDGDSEASAPPSNQQPSELYEIFLHNSRYPPLLQSDSWTLAVPYKELRHSRTPCETIANNYRPRAQNLKIQNLHQRETTTRLSPPHTPPAFCRDKRRRNPPPAAPQSPPLTPDEQLHIMKEQEARDQWAEPTERDLERYVYYVSEGIPGHLLAPQPPEHINILKLLPNRFHGDEQVMQRMREDLLEEVQRDYQLSLRRSIVDYILLDPSERERLSISAVPRPFPSRVIRGPVPWTDSYRDAHRWHSQNLFTVHPIMLELQKLWMSSFSSLRFVSLSDLLSADLPLLPSEFEELVNRRCQITRDELNTWLLRCASLFMTFKDSWLPLLRDAVTPGKAQTFFSCVAALMSLQLRSLVVASLQELLQFFLLHQDGNDFGGCYDDVRSAQRPVLLVKLRLEEPKIVFEPSLQTCWELINQSFTQIISSAHHLPRVECKLFSEVEETLDLRSVKPDETLVTDIINRAKEIYQNNTTGPQRYVDVYKTYSHLLDKQDILNFLKVKHSLQGFTKKITDVRTVRREISSLRVTVPLSLFCLDANRLNQDLCDKAEYLIDLLASSVLEENRDLNRSICRRYDEIMDRITSVPSNTEELVTLTRYLKHTSEVTIYRLHHEIQEAAKRLDFLLDHATLTAEDMKLNSAVLNWPELILYSIESCKEKLNNQRDQTELQLMRRIKSFEETLKRLDSEVEIFKKKEAMTAEEMKNNVEKLRKISRSVEAAVKELEDINREEGLLEREQSQYPVLQTLMVKKQPYEQLWPTALEFHNKSDVWMNGPFRQLSAEAVSEDLGNMWRVMHDLTNTFSERPCPGRVAENFTKRIEKFKKHLPLLTVICNPALTDRHWQTISGIVGFDVKPDVNASLLQMLELGLSKYSDRLVGISASASEEHSLENP